MNPTLRTSLITYGIVAASALFFCSKSIFVKIAYAHGGTTLTILALRMLFALPFFAVGAYLTGRTSPTALTLRQMAALAGLGFLGYYLSSLVNIAGLAHISVGLERMVLYTYPSLIVLGAALFKHQPITLKTSGACALGYGGIVLGFIGEATLRESQGSTIKGITLVFSSAVTYAIFVTLSGDWVKKLGPGRFTSWVVGFSCVFSMVHFAIHSLSKGSADDLFHAEPMVYVSGLLLAVVGTVIPAFLLGYGLRRAGAQKFAIISTIGPVGTVIFAWWILGEHLAPIQLIGLLLALGGGLAVTLFKDHRSESSTPPNKIEGLKETAQDPKP